MRRSAQPLLSLPQTGLLLASAGGLWVFSLSFENAFTLPRLLAASLGVGVAWLGLSMPETRIPVTRTALDRPWLALGAAALSSALFSLDRASAWMGRPGFYEGLFLLVVCVCSYYASAAVASREDGSVWTRGFAVAAGLAGLAAAFQAFGFEVVGRAVAGRAAGPAGTPVFLGFWLAAAFPFALKDALDRSWAVLGSISCLLIGAGLWATLSRGALLGAFVGGGVYLALRGGAGFWTQRRKWGAGLALLALLAVFSVKRPTLTADAQRAATWTLAGRVFLQRPLTGVGPDAFKLGVQKWRGDSWLSVVGFQHSPAQAHNDVLQAAATLGLVGLGAYAWLLWVVVLGARRTLSDTIKRDLAAAAAGSLAAVFFQAKFNPAPAALLITAAAFAGILVPCSGSKRFFEPRHVLGFLALASAPLLFHAVSDRRLRAAEVLVAQGEPGPAAAAYESAVRSFIGISQAQSRYTAYLLAWQQRASSLAQRRQMLERAVAVSGSLARRHPSDGEALQAHGVAVWVDGREKGNRVDEAAAVLEKAVELNPKHLPLRELRLAVARDAMDAAAAAREEAEIVRLRKLAPAAQAPLDRPGD